MSAALSLELSRALYAEADVRAAAAAVGDRADAELRRRGGSWLVELKPVDGVDAAAVEADFLSEALAGRCRREVRELLGPLADAVEAATRAEGFPLQPPDPLEQLEPVVREDRAADLARLRAEAERLRPL